MLTGLSVQAQRPYRGTFQSVRRVVLRLENRANIFRNSFEDWHSRATITAGNNENMNVTVRDFNDSVRRLRDRFDRRQATSFEVQDVLSRATTIDDFVRRNPMDARTQNSWSSIRSDLNQLASAYNLTWQMSSYYPPTNNPPYSYQALTGTYRIDRARSEDARVAAERAARNLSYSERNRMLELISRRLNSPDELAIDVQGRTVTLASTRAAQVSFDADGRDRVETSPNGRTVHSRAWLSGNQLTINSTGDRGNQFHVIFRPMDNGRTLSVTRRIYTPELNQTVEVRSTYEKTSDVARFDIYNPATNQYPTASGSFVVPDGTRVVAVLENDLSTRSAAVGERFTMRVTDPIEFQDARIEGHVSSIQRSGRLTGRSVMTLDFDNIQLRDGRTYQFAGLLEGVTTRDGESVRVDNEGAVRERNQTTQTEQRAAIGTAVGAIIGAIAGGGKGAAIGAILGAGAGAGSVYAQGRNDLDLNRGSQVIIRAGAPAFRSR
ncbi:MAG TPA: YMGG-like glycine zipper-containing protein [Verrucomicrobiae bacterium]